MSVSLIVLAAGLGTRMNSDRPKVLHHVAAAPLLHHALTAGRTLEPSRIVIGAGHGAEEVTTAAQAFDEACEVVIQDPQLGTAQQSGLIDMLHTPAGLYLEIVPEGEVLAASSLPPAELAAQLGSSGRSLYRRLKALEAAEGQHDHASRG